MRFRVKSFTLIGMISVRGLVPRSHSRSKPLCHEDFLSRDVSLSMKPKQEAPNVNTLLRYKNIAQQEEEVTDWVGKWFEEKITKLDSSTWNHGKGNSFTSKPGPLHNKKKVIHNRVVEVRNYESITSEFSVLFTLCF